MPGEPLPGAAVASLFTAAPPHSRLASPHRSCRCMVASLLPRGSDRCLHGMLRAVCACTWGVLRACWRSLAGWLVRSAHARFRDSGARSRVRRLPRPAPTSLPCACEILARPTFRAMLGRCGVCAGEGIRRGGGYSLVILQGKEGIPFTNSTREGGHFGLFPCLAEHAPEARFFKQLPWCWQAKTRG